MERTSTSAAGFLCLLLITYSSLFIPLCHYIFLIALLILFPLSWSISSYLIFYDKVLNLVDRTWYYDFNHYANIVISSDASPMRKPKKS